ncbi:hypothetical protein FACUT_13616 [Fusarium acutatum]|uniref:Uncharacterized protein n=1 Tax=Fusarium acutatum TaxID=78861 RepID=A0A8H4N8H0_9HYPO|nr:hypothetical protein FACUT_13616 [Fusarium acutatum]
MRAAAASPGQGRETRVYQGTACGRNWGEVPVPTCLSATSPADQQASKQARLTLTLPDGREWVRPNREVDRGGQYSTAQRTTQRSTVPNLGSDSAKHRLTAPSLQQGDAIFGRCAKIPARGLIDGKPSGELCLSGLSEPRSTATLSPTATNSKSFAGPNVPFLYTNIFSFASVHWGRGCGGVPDGAPDGACGRINRTLQAALEQLRVTVEYLMTTFTAKNGSSTTERPTATK